MNLPAAAALYNSLMRGWTATSIVLTVALLAAAGYLTYRVSTVATTYSRINHYRKEYYQEGRALTAAEVDRALEEIERDYERHPSPQLAAFVFDMSLRQAWNRPETMVPALGRALELGPDLYQDPYLREPVGLQLCWAYVYGGLPAQLEWWKDEALARLADQRQHILHMVFLARLLEDDEAGARQLIADELAARGSQTATKELAFSAYVALEEFIAADQYAEAVAGDPELDVNTRFDYASYLLHRGEFTQAAEQYRTAWKDLDSAGDGALELAVALTAEAGSLSLEAREMLKLAAAHERNNISELGAEAWVYADLYQATNEAKWREQLLALAGPTPQEFDVAAALAAASLAELQGKATRPPGAPPLPDPATLMIAAEPNATSGADRQTALIFQALATAHRAAGSGDSPAAYLEAARYLKLALQPPESAAFADSQNVPDYTVFTLDPVVKALRQRQPAFDTAVHQAIATYLDDRAKLFAPYIKLAQPSKPTTEAPPPAEDPAQFLSSR